MWALKNSVLVSMSTVYLNFDRRETRLETVVLVSRVCKNLSNTLLHTFLKRVKLHYKSLYIPPMNTVPQGGQTESLCEGNGGMWSLEISAGLWSHGHHSQEFSAWRTFSATCCSSGHVHFVMLRVKTRNNAIRASSFCPAIIATIIIKAIIVLIFYSTCYHSNFIYWPLDPSHHHCDPVHPPPRPPSLGALLVLL